MEQIESYLINQKLYVSTKFLSGYFNRSDKQIARWKTSGLEPANKPKELNKRGDFFILEEVLKWHEKNINKTKSNNSRSIVSEDGNIDLSMYESLSASQKREQLRLLDKNSLDGKRVVEEIIEKEFKNKQHEKEWVRKEKPSQTIKALARTFISLLKNMMITISKDGENKNQDELYHIMDKYLHQEIIKLQNLLKDESKLDLYEIYNKIIDLHSQGTSIENIIKKLEELK